MTTKAVLNKDKICYDQRYIDIGYFHSNVTSSLPILP